jgi:hypothetical protein
LITSAPATSVQPREKKTAPVREGADRVAHAVSLAGDETERID